jgi:hypothetical protein
VDERAKRGLVVLLALEPLECFYALAALRLGGVTAGEQAVAVG